MKVLGLLEEDQLAEQDARKLAALSSVQKQALAAVRAVQDVLSVLEKEAQEYVEEQRLLYDDTECRWYTWAVCKYGHLDIKLISPSRLIPMPHDVWLVQSEGCGECSRLVAAVSSFLASLHHSTQDSAFINIMARSLLDFASRMSFDDSEAVEEILLTLESAWCESLPEPLGIIAYPARPRFNVTEVHEIAYKQSANQERKGE